MMSEPYLEVEMSTIKHARVAKTKIKAGALLTIDEVAALLSIAPSTVHKLPLPSVRISRNLRFDPADVVSLVEKCKEPIVA